MASPVQLRFTAASCKLLQITRLTKWIAIGVPQLHDPGGSNGISKRVLSRVLDEMHTLRCRQGHTFTRGINTGNLGKPVFVVSGSYVRAVSLSPFFFLLLLFLSFPLSFSFFYFTLRSVFAQWPMQKSRKSLWSFSCSLDFSSALFDPSFLVF